MPQIPKEEFERLPLRVHGFLAGVPLHDAWAMDLPRARRGITLHDFLRSAGARQFALSQTGRTLVSLRLFVGRVLGWDREPGVTEWESFTSRLTAEDCANSLVPTGTREGLFRVVYHFKNEQLLEIINRTAHAAALSALVETGGVYRFYFGVYVRSVGLFTPIYMTLINPFRKLIVYPSLLRSVAETWKETYGPI